MDPPPATPTNAEAIAVGVVNALELARVHQSHNLTFAKTSIRLADVREILRYFHPSQDPLCTGTNLRFDRCCIDADAFKMLMESEDVRRCMKHLEVTECLDLDWDWTLGLPCMLALKTLTVKHMTMRTNTFPYAIQGLLASEQCELVQLTLLRLDEHTRQDVIPRIAYGIRTPSRVAPCKLQFISLTVPKYDDNSMQDLALALTKCPDLNEISIGSDSQHHVAHWDVHHLVCNIPRYLKLCHFSLDVNDDLSLKRVLADTHTHMLATTTPQVQAEVRARIAVMDKHFSREQESVAAMLHAVRGHPLLHNLHLTVQGVGVWDVIHPARVYIDAMNSPRSRILAALSSAYDVPRLGAESAFSRMLPKDIVRLLGEMLPKKEKESYSYE